VHAGGAEIGAAVEFYALQAFREGIGAGAEAVGAALGFVVRPDFGGRLATGEEEAGGGKGGEGGKAYRHR
jgi:hypothetical protein